MPMKFGPATRKPIAASNPTESPATAPAVLNRRQKIESTITGKFAEAATAIPKSARIAAFEAGPSLIAIRMETAPMARAAMRATSTVSPGLRSTPLCTTFIQKSCAKEVDALIISPATTARIVAKATAETTARKASPPSACASNGPLMLVPPWVTM